MIPVHPPLSGLVPRQALAGHCEWRDGKTLTAPERHAVRWGDENDTGLAQHRSVDQAVMRIVGAQGGPLACVCVCEVLSGRKSRQLGGTQERPGL